MVDKRGQEFCASLATSCVGMQREVMPYGKDNDKRLNESQDETMDE